MREMLGKSVSVTASELRRSVASSAGDFLGRRHGAPIDVSYSWSKAGESLTLFVD